MSLHHLSDVAPAKVHITLPIGFRVQREIPGYLVVHHEDLPSEDVSRLEGMPITTPARTIRDCIAAHQGPALVRQAIDEARRVPPPAPSVGKLEKYVLAYANREGVVVTPVRHWISFMMLSGALDRNEVGAHGPRFIVKGGVALELRLPTRARATDDLDIVAACDENDLVAALDAALRQPYHDCTFSRRADTRQLGDNAVL